MDNEDNDKKNDDKADINEENKEGGQKKVSVVYNNKSPFVFLDGPEEPPFGGQIK